jgi:hypothetical protein
LPQGRDHLGGPRAGRCHCCGEIVRCQLGGPVGVLRRTWSSCPWATRRERSDWRGGRATGAGRRSAEGGRVWAVWVSGGPGCSGHGDHAVAEELHDRDRVIARGARAADADPALEAPVVFADLVADGSGSAAVALIDGDRLAGLGLRHGKARLGCVATSFVRGGPAGVAAVPPAAGGLERLAASGASHRDVVVTRRRFAVPWTLGAMTSR